MTSTIQTNKVTDRRRLHFASPADILADVDQLAGRRVRALGNWTPGQIFQHLAISVNDSIDGFPGRAPWPIRVLGRLFLKRKFLTRPMAAGFQLPRQAAFLLPPPTDWDDGLRNVRDALRRLINETKRMSHPVFGPLSVEEWNQLHCRHSELHLSFLVPEA